MDINDTLGKLVTQLNEDIIKNIQVDVEKRLASLIQQRIGKIDFDSIARECIGDKIDKYLEEKTDWFNSVSEPVVNSIIGSIKESVEKQIPAEVQYLLSTQANSIDEYAMAAYESVVQKKIKTFKFPEKSIPASAINSKQNKLSGNDIQGGVIENFGSTGIDDRSTSCQVTIMDENTVIENNLVANGLTIKGNTILEGDVIIRGVVPVDCQMFQNLVTHSKNRVIENLNQDLYSRYSDLVFSKIQNDGLDLSRITFNKKEVIRDNQLTNAITESGLQKLGILRELQVSGESVLGGLYATKKRVGINTMDPSSALSVWDEETEINIGKRSKDVVWINTPRSQSVIFSSNNKENLTLNTDGSTQIKNLQIGNQSFSSSNKAPNYESSKGTVVFNADPNLGGPLGWVCLGGAQWANFGIID